MLDVYLDASSDSYMIAITLEEACFDYRVLSCGTDEPPRLEHSLSREPQTLSGVINIMTFLTENAPRLQSHEPELAIRHMRWAIEEMNPFLIERTEQVLLKLAELIGEKASILPAYSVADIAAFVGISDADIKLDQLEGEAYGRVSKWFHLTRERTPLQRARQLLP